MDIAVATDFAGSTGDHDLSLRALAEAGFASLHWCHHWCDDFHYGKHELAYIKSLLKQYHLRLLDIHGSQGVEKCWHSTVEYRRREGVDLVANRIRMLRELSFELSMTHTPFLKGGGEPGVKQPYENRLAFARDAFERGSRFARQVAAARQAVE